MLEKRKLELLSERNRLLVIVNASNDTKAGDAWIDLELVDLELGMIIDAIELNAEDPRKGW